MFLWVFLHSLGTYAEKATFEWEKIIQEQGNMHGGLKVTQMSQTYNLLFEVSKLLSKSHGHQKQTNKKKMEKLMNGSHI